MRNLHGIGILLCVCFATAAILPQNAAVLPDGYRMEPFARSLSEPSASAMAQDGRVFILERVTGDVRVVQHGKLLATPFVTLPVATDAGTTENGALGIALHPDFNANGWVYIYYTHDLGGGSSTNRIVRYTAEGILGIDPVVILDNIGVGPTGEDNGGALAFGADGMLYAAVGVMENDSDASSLSSLGGKILRLDPADGSAPADNPHVGLSAPYDLIWALGLHNTSGLAVDPVVGTLYVTDEYVDEGGVDCDEINVILENVDYGWDSLSCGTQGYPPAPMQTINPKVECAGVVSYFGNSFPGSCSNDAARDCLTADDCKACDGTTDRCTGDADCSTCSNLPGQSCTIDDDCMACEDDPSDTCVADIECKTCSKSFGRCLYDLDCPLGGDKCESVYSCVPHTCDLGSCLTNPCAEPSDYMFVAGKGSGIVRDTLTGVDKDELLASSDFYAPESPCPTGVSDLQMGEDGWVYATAAGTGPGIYRMVYDGGAEPRETSATPYAPMTLGKDGAGLRFWWEDLKKDAWGCSEGRSYCSDEILTFCNTGADCVGTCDPRSCPAGSDTTKYTVWSGTLTSPFTYGHSAMAETSGADDGDALITHLEATMPTGDKYFLVSARGNNMEGGLGYNSSDVERTGYGTTDKCDDIGYGSSRRDYERCFGEFPKPYADQHNEMWTMADFRGQTLLISMMQYG